MVQAQIMVPLYIKLHVELMIILVYLCNICFIGNIVIIRSNDEDANEEIKKLKQQVTVHGLNLVQFEDKIGIIILFLPYSLGRNYILYLLIYYYLFN